MKSPKTVVQDWVAAYNACDPQALIELCRDDADLTRILPSGLAS